MTNLFNKIYKGKKVLVTGHTGFKGSWLVQWLELLGADVAGYSLEPPTEINHFDKLSLNVQSIISDVRDRESLVKALVSFKPDIVFHLAAQPIVRYSYDNPLETFDTNVMGLLNVLESCRNIDSVKAIVNITSDKCYENREWVWGYRENDPMGGHDPYSASKGCSELVTSSYRNSFFNNDEYNKSHTTLLASVRAGNVIGGGDWAQDRLIPDIMKAVDIGEEVIIRSPGATRPWQHVLEPLSGYLNIGQKLLEQNVKFADSWNFGPESEGAITVKEVVKNVKKYWSKIKYRIEEESTLHEANMLKLDCSKADTYLKWKSVWNSSETFEKTVDWYKRYYENSEIITIKQIDEYVQDAKNKQIEWAVK